MKTLKHPHVITYLGSEIIDDFIHIYMEYMAGGNLLSVIQKFGKLNEDMIKVYAK